MLTKEIPHHLELLDDHRHNFMDAARALRQNLLLRQNQFGEFPKKPINSPHTNQQIRKSITAAVNGFKYTLTSASLEANQISGLFKHTTSALDTALILYQSSPPKNIKVPTAALNAYSVFIATIGHLTNHGSFSFSKLTSPIDNLDLGAIETQKTHWHKPWTPEDIWNNLQLMSLALEDQNPQALLSNPQLIRAGHLLSAASLISTQ